MKLDVSRIGRDLCSLLLAGTLAVDFALKPFADLQELLWACYLGSIVLILGTLFRLDLLVASASLFFVSIGFPAWMIALLIHYRALEPTSLLMHIVPLGFAGFYFSGSDGLPRTSGFGAWLLFVLPFGASALFSDPVRNINLIQIPVRSFHVVFPSIWGYRISVLGVSAGCAFLAHHTLSSRRKRRPTTLSCPPGPHA